MNTHILHAATQQPYARYTAGAVLLHWLLALLLIGQIGFGLFLETVPRGTPARGMYVNMHKSFGIALALLILVRLIWRLTHPAPPLPVLVSSWERLGSKCTQFGLYACMIVMPLSGYLASNFSKHGVKLFNVMTLAPWGPDNPAVYGALNKTHGVTSFVFEALIVVHLLGAARHALRRDGIISRMGLRASS